MFKNKTALSATTLHIIEQRALEDELHYEYIDDLTAERWRHLNHEEKAVTNSQTRTGYDLSTKKLTKSPENPLQRKIGRGPLITILEDALREYDSTDPSKLHPEQLTDPQQSSKNLKENTGEKGLGFDSDRDILDIPLSTVKRSPDKYSGPFSPSKNPPVDTRPYTPNVLHMLEDHRIIESTIVNKPEGHIQTRISKEIRGETIYCHGRSKERQKKDKHAAL